jgi:methylated-DNA-[protein]-cysteine S-methyltransferase
MTSVHSQAIFATAIGGCGIAWSDAGIAAVLLPEGSKAATRARLRRLFPAAREAVPAGAVQDAIGRIGTLLRGETAELAGIVLDMSGIGEFERRVYALARTIPPGATLTYGEVAARIGDKGAARAVGRALGRNPFPIIVPCHRVLAAAGGLGGFSAPGGVTTKLRLLAIERARTTAAPMLFDALPLQAPPRARRGRS